MARTIVLGALAAAAGIWWLARAYDIEGADLVGYLGGSMLLVAGAIVAAIAGALAMRLVGRHRRRPFLGRHSPRQGSYGRSVKKRSNRGR